MVKVVEIIARDHSKWVEVVRSFGLKDDAEDVVQDMYLKINEWKGKYDKTLMFNDTEVNHYFVFKVLRNIFLDKVKKTNKTISITHTFYEPSISDISFEYEERLNQVYKEIESWSLYERKIYELIFIENKSMLELSKLTGIDYYSIYRTVKKIKRILNNKINNNEN